MKTAVTVLVDFFLARGCFDFAGMGVEHMRGSYNWKNQDYQSTLRQKQLLHEEWVEASQLLAPRRQVVHLELARKIVKDWGGIRRIGDKRLTTYIAETDLEEDKIPYAGIASRSKILPLMDPDKFVILDARVVNAILLVQLMDPPEQGVIFPWLASRNRMFNRTNTNGFMGRVHLQSQVLGQDYSGWQPQDKTGAYGAYLTLLRQVSKRLEAEGFKHKLFDLEMTLFWQVTALLQTYDMRSNSRAAISPPRQVAG